MKTFAQIVAVQLNLIAFFSFGLLLHTETPSLYILAGLFGGIVGAVAIGEDWGK